MPPPSTPTPESLLNTGKSLGLPIASVVISAVLALLLAPVKFGPLFYAHNEPQVIVNPGALTGMAICFLTFPAIVWLMARIGSGPGRS